MEMPFTDRDMQIWGFTAWRCLDNGLVIAVGPMSISNGRLFWDVHQGGYADFYCYESLELAEASMMAFDPAVEKEPAGWHRHASTGRRRPGGDAAKEYINR